MDSGPSHSCVEVVRMRAFFARLLLNPLARPAGRWVSFS